MDQHRQDALRADLASHIPPAARAAVVQAIDLAYRDAGAMWDAEKGCDALWFGMTRWKFIEHRIRELVLTDTALGLRELSRGYGAFRLGAGPFVLTPYGCGTQAPTDPWTCFPSNNKGAGFLSDANAGQFELELLFPDLPPDPHAIVIAHYGNFAEGLVALYFKLPLEQSRGRITRWGYVEDVWHLRAGQDTQPDPFPKPAVLPGPAQVERPRLLPFKKPQRQNDTGNAS
jgi:hypothetical protein